MLNFYVTLWSCLCLLLPLSYSLLCFAVFQFFILKIQAHLVSSSTLKKNVNLAGLPLPFIALFSGHRAAVWSSSYVPQCTYTIQFLYFCEKIVLADLSVSIAVLQGKVNRANCRWKSLHLNWRQTRTWVSCIVHHNIICWSIFFSLFPHLVSHCLNLHFDCFCIYVYYWLEGVLCLKSTIAALATVIFLQLRLLNNIEQDVHV